ncbi:SCO2322 family protein [Streptomyces litchfieldiae]|uniref:SCO2322 family protein n=1 Tax=Streptomyces litchfieldiae TaxID=3075543 RepID=A0ABU2MXD7_9ACTN|nr:SCO2322 family protein [Streptomyces sp. DSM 44938]MDT0346310.1 SCO2322 family protein [Streptomyces sp. DSM 44938]
MTGWLPWGRRAPLAMAVLLGLAGLVAGAGAAPAAADDSGYRYWSFWTWDEADGGWAYATQGPGTLRPSDGDVLGFRFAVSTESSDTQEPRGESDFAAICGDAAESGGERVALVIDFGTAEDAPGGESPPQPRTECAELPDGGTAAEALAATAEPLRYNSDALLCAIAGYPERGCADQLGGGSEESNASEGDAEDGGGGGSAGALAAGAGVVVLLAAAAVVRARRRRG